MPGRQRGSSEPDSGKSQLRQALSDHPYLVSLLLACTLVGSVVGFFVLTPDWSVARRVLGGAIAGFGCGFLVTAIRFMGAFDR